MKKKITDHTLYLVASSSYRPEIPLAAIAEQAIAGGIDMLQLREKNMPAAALAETARALARLCAEKNVTFIVNDDPVLAQRVNADGVHLGQEDLLKFPLHAARAIVGHDRLIGVSTHSIREFEAAEKSDCDYIAYGPVFTTQTKPYCVGTGDVEYLLARARKPLIFIGGITVRTLDLLREKGAKNFALISALMRAENITHAARELKNRIVPAPLQAVSP